MSLWKEATLGEICDAVNGVIQTGPFGSQLHQSDYSEVGIPVVMPKDIVEGRISADTVARVSAEHVERLSRHKLSAGDIVYGRRGDIGRQALIRPEQAGWMCGTGCLRLSLGTAVIDPLFLHYYLKQGEVVRWIANQAVGATMPNLNTGILRSVPVRFPALPIQRRIACILSAYDELIENSQRRIKILEAIARALYREWFVYYRFPNHENSARQPQWTVAGDPAGASAKNGARQSVPRVPPPQCEIPPGWEVKRLGEVADTFRGRSYRSADLADEGGLPFLNLKCLDRDGGFRRSGLKRYTGEFKDIHIARKGDIMMAVTDMTQERRIVARAALVPTLDNEFGIFSMDLVRIEPKPGLPKAFLYSFLRYSSFADEVKQHANGANVLHLSPNRITDYRFAVPPTDLMTRFASVVAPVVEEIDTLANKIDNLHRTRDLLLPRMFSGQIDVESMLS